VGQTQGGPPPLDIETSIWTARTLGWKVNDTVRLIVHDRTADYVVRGVFDAQDQAIVMDLGAAQQAVRRAGKIDRIEIALPRGADPALWRERLAPAIPAGVELRTRGLAQDQNRKMLEGFRWNLRALSYMSGRSSSTTPSPSRWCAAAPKLALCARWASPEIR
jgi:hypothetical protein